jgi:hypothetical protein
MDSFGVTVTSYVALLCLLERGRSRTLRVCSECWIIRLAILWSIGDFCSVAHWRYQVAMRYVPYHIWKPGSLFHPSLVPGLFLTFLPSPSRYSSGWALASWIISLHFSLFFVCSDNEASNGRIKKWEECGWKRSWPIRSWLSGCWTI